MRRREWRQGGLAQTGGFASAARGQHWSDDTPDDPNPLFIAPVVQDGTIASDIYAGGEFLRKSSKGFRTGSADWSQLFDAGAGHSISTLAVSGGTGYAAWCGPCWPGYVSETGFNRGLITNIGGSWQPLDLSNVPAGCDAIPNRYISGLAIDPRNSKHASLSLSGYARH